MDTLACQSRKNVAKCDNSFEMRTTWLFEILNANCAPQFIGGPVCLSAKYKLSSIYYSCSSMFGCIELQNKVALDASAVLNTIATNNLDNGVILDQ